MQSDGKILIGGGFTEYQSNNVNGLVRINSDGSRDYSFNIGNGFFYSEGDSAVGAIAVQDNGKIIVGGYFTEYNGETANRIIRLNSDGSRDNTFNILNGFTQYSEIYSIVTQSDGKIMIGGYFTEYNGETANKIIRLNIDGSRDTTFYIGTGFNNGVHTLTLQTDGKILVGGSSNEYNGEQVNKIIRLNPDGTLDTSFNLGTGFNSNVGTLTLQADGKILIGVYAKVIRLNSDGSKDKNLSMGNGFNGQITSVIQQIDGKVIVGGYFSEYSGEPSNGIVRLNSDGSRDNSFIDTNIDSNNGDVYILALQADGKIIVGGYYLKYFEDNDNNGLVRLNSDGSRDMSFESLQEIGDYQEVYSLAIQSDGKILVGGYFEKYNGEDIYTGVIRLNSDGSRDTSFNVVTGFNGDINAFVPQVDGKILIGGWFNQYNGEESNYIIRLNSDGSRDTSFNTGAGFANGGVSTLTLQPDGKIIVGGSFTKYDGETTGYGIVRLNSDGSRDTSFDVGMGFNDTVVTIKQQDDGKILVGGYFTQYNEDQANYIIRLNSDGARDRSFNLGGVPDVSTNEEWKGDIAQVSIYDRALSSEEILQNFNSSKSRYGFSSESITPSIVSNGLITHLDAGNINSYSGIGDKWLDLSGNNNDAQLFNGVSYSNSNGGSFKFDGEDDASIVNLASDKTFTDISYSAWVKTEVEADSYRTIIDFDGNNTLLMATYDGEFMSYNPYFESGYTLEPNTWYHLSMTYSDGNEIALYINGTLVYSEVADSGYEYTADNFSIGAGAYVDMINSGFDNYVQDIYIQKDGKILAGGYFKRYQGILSPSLIRLGY